MSMSLAFVKERMAVNGIVPRMGTPLCAAFLAANPSCVGCLSYNACRRLNIANRVIEEGKRLIHIVPPELYADVVRECADTLLALCNEQTNKEEGKP